MNIILGVCQLLRENQELEQEMSKQFKEEMIGHQVNSMGDQTTLTMMVMYIEPMARRCQVDPIGGQTAPITVVM